MRTGRVADRPFTLTQTWILFVVCLAILSGVAGWIAHGVVLH